MEYRLTDAARPPAPKMHLLREPAVAVIEYRPGGTGGDMVSMLTRLMQLPYAQMTLAKIDSVGAEYRFGTSVLKFIDDGNANHDDLLLNNLGSELFTGGGSGRVQEISLQTGRELLVLKDLGLFWVDVTNSLRLDSGEVTPADATAFDRLILEQSYRFVGTKGADILLEDQVNSDGMVMALNGDDHFIFRGGAGADLFVYTDIDHGGVGSAADSDIIVTFRLKQGDKLLLDNPLAWTITSQGNENLTLVNTNGLQIELMFVRTGDKTIDDLISRTIPCAKGHEFARPAPHCCPPHGP